MDTCGEPPLLANREAAVLLWEDCGTGMWYLRATAGGSISKVSYEGTIVSDRAFSSVNPAGVESGDLLATPTNDQILFQFNVSKDRTDGLDFLFPARANVCVSLDTPGASLLVGAGRTPVSGSLDLTTLGSCGASPSCGEPDYDPSVQAGLRIWQDCTTGTWEVRASGGGSASVSTYQGRVVASQAFSSIEPVSLENNDSLNTPTTKSITYDLNVTGPWEDGFRFENPDAASVCVDSDVAGEKVLVGPTGVVASTPFNLADLGACAASSDSNRPAECSRAPVISTTRETQPYLEDGEPDVTTAGELPYPRISIGTGLRRIEPERHSKYDVIFGKGFLINDIGKVQAINPDVEGLRLNSALAFQAYDGKTCSASAGVPFAGTGPSTQGCNMFAGHWLYKAGTQLTGAVSAGATQLRVQNANSFVVGEYVVIYDAPAGSFKNAEHARITAVSKSTNTLTVSRGYKSTAASHSVGAIVAAHALGQGTDKRLWAWNQSSTCPKDGSGRRWNQVMADWLAVNYDKDANGNPVKAKIDGVIFDADAHFLQSRERRRCRQRPDRR